MWRFISPYIYVYIFATVIVFTEFCNNFEKLDNVTYNEVQQEEKCAGNNFLNWELWDWNLYTLLLFISVLCIIFWSSPPPHPPQKNTLTHACAHTDKWFAVHSCHRNWNCTLVCLSCSCEVSCNSQRLCFISQNIQCLNFVFDEAAKENKRTCLNLMKKCYKKIKENLQAEILRKRLEAFKLELWF